MDTKTFFDNFETIANAPGGIARLRELILDLAIEGMLTKSDLSAWSESNLGNVVEIIRGVTFPASAKQRSPMKGLIPCLRTANVQNEVDWDDLLYISEEYVRKESQIVKKDDILMSMANSRELVGKVALVKRDDLRCTLGGFIAALRCSEAILPEFLMSILRVPSARDKLIDSSTQTTNIANISIGRLKPFEIRIPPVEVQKRIVAKVDELMALCDQLESAQQQRDSLKTSARNSAIDSISTASTAEELGAAWKRINQNWTTFADTPESISSLRTLILKSAGEGKLQRNSATPKSGPRASLGELCDIYQPKTISKNELIEDGKYLVYGANGVIGRYDKFNHEFEEVTVTCRGATCGTVNVTAPKSWINGNAMVVRPKVDELTKEFLAVILRGLDYETVITGSAQPQITRQPLAKVLIWIPKLAEQQKIVFQVDRLMSLCDVLESALLKQAELEEQISRAVTSEVAA